MRFGTMLIYRPDGDVQTFRGPADQRPTLKELQEAVGGLIEPVDARIGGPGTPTVAYANDEAWMLHPDKRQHNDRATRLLLWPYALVGPVVVCHGFDPDPEDGPAGPRCECLACEREIPIRWSRRAVEAAIRDWVNARRAGAEMHTS